MNRDYWWVLPLSVLWPVAHLALFLMRFGQLPAGSARESAVFLPMGILSAVVFVILLAGAGSRRQRLATWLGYLAACPFALVGSLLSGLLFPSLLGTLIFGALPLIAGSWIGSALGGRTGQPMVDDAA